jgi:hypothetical protein
VARPVPNTDHRARAATHRQTATELEATARDAAAEGDREAARLNSVAARASREAANTHDEAATVKRLQERERAALAADQERRRQEAEAKIGDTAGRLDEARAKEEAAKKRLEDLRAGRTEPAPKPAGRRQNFQTLRKQAAEGMAAGAAAMQQPHDGSPLPEQPMYASLSADQRADLDAQHRAAKTRQDARGVELLAQRFAAEAESNRRADAARNSPQSTATVVDKPTTGGNTTPVQPQSAGASTGGGAMKDLLSHDSGTFDRNDPPRFDYTGDSSMGPMAGLNLTGGKRSKLPDGTEIVEFEWQKVGDKFGNPKVKLAGRPGLRAALEKHEAAVQSHEAAKKDADRKAAKLVDVNPDSSIGYHAVANIGGEPHYVWQSSLDSYADYRLKPVSAGVPTISDAGTIGVNTQYSIANSGGQPHQQKDDVLRAAMRFGKARYAAEQEAAAKAKITDDAARTADAAAHAKRVVDLTATAKQTGKPQLLDSHEEEVDEEDNSLTIVARHVHPDGTVKTTRTRTY